jgi:membrane fusion protein, copper/silver efflux system
MTKMTKLAGAAAILAATTWGAIALAGAGDAAPVDSGGHNHGAAAPAAQGPVTLSSDQARRIGVTYAIAELTPMRGEIRTVGQVTFDETRIRSISPKIEGWVERLHVNYTGQSVSAGQPLLSVYSPMLVAAQEELLLAKRLGADVAGGTEEARRSAAELLASARRRLLYWDIPAEEIAAIERSGEVRRALTIRAPFGGHVLEKNVFPGQRIMMGDALYKVADLSVVWIEGEVFERDLPSVKLGQQVAATFDALPGATRTGRITYVYPTVNPETRTARVRVELPNTGMQLKPGMYATFSVDGGTDAQALTVPRAAVLATGQRNLVFVRRADGVLEPRGVTLGAAAGERIAILSGLVAGETVVASATFLVDAESNLASLLSGMAPAAVPAVDTPGHQH